MSTHHSQKQSLASAAEQPFTLQEEFITLGQLLKALGLVGTGGEAKYFLAENPVSVNGDPEDRRGRKLYPQDLILLPDTPPIRIRGR